MIPVGNINPWLVFRGAMLDSPAKSGFFPDGKRVVSFQISEGRLEGKVILNSKPPSGRFFTMMVPW